MGYSVVVCCTEEVVFFDEAEYGGGTLRSIPQLRFNCGAAHQLIAGRWCRVSNIKQQAQRRQPHC